MVDVILSQSEADALIRMNKHRTDESLHQYPMPGNSIAVPLIAAGGSEKFLLDVTRGKINLKKVTYQTRVRSVTVLVRLDIEGPPHCNPDGAEIPCPHLHIYREGYGTKWARRISQQEFNQPSDLWISFDDFMRFRNIQNHLILKAICSYE